MIAYKGLDVLLETLEALAARNDWRLTVAGEGPALTDEVLARLRRFPQVDARRGWLSDVEVEAMLREGDVLLAPYISATQSGMIAAAVALGKPCIVTRVGALAEQIGEGEAGWVAESPRTFAASVVSALDAPDAVWGEKCAGAVALAQRMWLAQSWRFLEAL
jgi:glycosyltransferase involved in cell wall biosynthesis